MSLLKRTCRSFFADFSPGGIHDDSMKSQEQKSRRLRWLEKTGWRVCPRTGQVRVKFSRPGWRGWGLIVIGFTALLWYLIRVVPKPSRAAYPCQRMAAPMAGGFLAWLVAVWASAMIWRRGRVFSRQAQLGWAIICFGAAAGVGSLAFLYLPSSRVSASITEPHSPLGTAQGLYPGRVVWVHAPEATDWAGPRSGELWYDSNHTDLAVVEEMMTQALHAVSGTNRDDEAWAAIFRFFNQKHQRGDRSYQAGEKIAVKINLTGCNARSWQVDPNTYEKKSDYLDWIDNSPQMILALLRQLVYQVGVAPGDIAVGDPTGLFPKFLYDPLHAEFPDVIYFDNYGKPGSGRTRVQFSDKTFAWSTPTAAGKRQDYVPVHFAEADYLINFAILKGHSCGFTACAKNHYGSLLRCPDGYLRDAGIQKDYYSMHQTLPGSGGSVDMGHYRALVDLMGHPDLGGKTLLYLIDGLYGGYYWEGKAYRWKTAPFGDGTNGDWPSSLFASLDPVAIDSVAYDFLRNEWPQVVTGGTGRAGSLGDSPQDYLHEAAQADQSPSQTRYDPANSGTPLASLGVHEHWNNASEKKYSRNLGPSHGIELIALHVDRPRPRMAIEKVEQKSVIRWQGSLTGFQLERTSSLLPPVQWTPINADPALVRGMNTVTNPADAGPTFYRLSK
jgi:hypothetical protein